MSSRWTLRDLTGAPTGSLELNTDITKRKQAEEALKAAHEELERHVMERTCELSKRMHDSKSCPDGSLKSRNLKDARSLGIFMTRSARP